MTLLCPALHLGQGRPRSASLPLPCPRPAPEPKGEKRHHVANWDREGYGAAVTALPECPCPAESWLRGACLQNPTQFQGLSRADAGPRRPSRRQAEGQVSHLRGPPWHRPRNEPWGRLWGMDPAAAGSRLSLRRSVNTHPEGLQARPTSGSRLWPGVPAKPSALRLAPPHALGCHPLSSACLK